MTDSRPTLLTLWPGPKGWEDTIARLSDYYEVITPQNFDEKTLEELIPRADVAVGPRISSRLVRTAERLKLLLTPGAGINGLALEALRERGIIVCNIHSHAPFVAEHAVSMLLALMKKVAIHDRLMRQGIWFGPSGTSKDEHYLSDSLIGGVVGLIGFGHIGQEILTLLAGFRVKPLAHVHRLDQHTEDKKRFRGLRFAPLDEVLAESDAVFLTVPLTQATTAMIGEPQLDAMKKTAYLVNVARAGVVDSDALLAALIENRIRGAASDAWEKDRSITRLFAELDNMMLSPHRAGTLRDFTPYLHDLEENLIAYATSGEIRNQVDLKAGY